MAAIRVCSSTSSSSSNWACLPADLLGSIIDKFHDNLSDYFRFSTVCKSWNSIALNHRARLNIPPQLPWLLITSNSELDNINGEPMPCFYNFFMGSEIPNIKLPFNFNPNMCRGSSHGWLVYVEDKLTLIVLNPLSGNTVRLPRLTDALVHVHGCEDEVVEKVILSRDPAPACLGSFEVLAICSIYNGNKIVAHLKYGDESWTYSSENNFIKVAFYKDRIFGLSREGIVTSLAVDPSSKVIKITKDVAPRHSWKRLLKAVIKTNKHIAPERSRRGSGNCVLCQDFIESTNGDLLIVTRLLRSGYKIQKLMIDSKGRLELIPIVDLGNDTLFLGKYGSISISASTHPNCDPDDIYDFLDNNIMFDDIYLEEDGMTLEYHDCDKSILGWFMPSMKL